MSAAHPSDTELRRIEELQGAWLAKLSGDRQLTPGPTRLGGNPLKVLTHPDYCSGRREFKPGIGLVYYRQILKNEIVIESDAPEWETQVSVARSIWKYCDGRIPFVAGYTGGKSIHFHIFFDPSPCLRAVEGFTNEEIDHVDPFQIARSLLFDELVKKCRLDKASHPEYEIDFSFNGKASTGDQHIIREFGCPYYSHPKELKGRAGEWNGKFKTLLRACP